MAALIGSQSSRIFSRYEPFEGGRVNIQGFVGTVDTQSQQAASSVGPVGAVQLADGSGNFTGSSGLVLTSGSDLVISSSGPATGAYQIGGFPIARFGIDTTDLYLGVSGNDLITGRYNTLVGYFAGAVLSTGARNTFVGVNAGNLAVTTINAVAVGNDSGASSNSVSVGNGSGQTNQGINAVAVGSSAGQINQGARTVAVGSFSGYSGQQVWGTAVGYLAGQTSQGTGAIAVGYLAGNTSQGSNSIAIGQQAGRSSQPSNSICLNASGLQLNPSTGGFYINPVRQVQDSGASYSLLYNKTTSEVTASPSFNASNPPNMLSSPPSSTGAAGSAWYGSFTGATPTNLVTSGGRLVVNCGMSVQSSSFPNLLQFNLYIDGTSVGVIGSINIQAPGNWEVSGSIVVSGIAAGSHRVSMKLVGGGGGFLDNSDRCTVSVLELPIV